MDISSAWALVSCYSNALGALALSRHHRSHFGSRYKLGCCGHAGLFVDMCSHVSAEQRELSADSSSSIFALS